MDKNLLEQLNRFFATYPEIKLAYFFGSRARKESGPLSDYDLAIFLEGEKKKFLDIRLELLDKISRLLKTDRVDVVLLNSLEEPEMKYNIISEGELIFEREPFRLIVEPRILNEYFDFTAWLRQHHLTKAKL